MAKKKKITILSWEILEMGGINSLIMGFQSGFPKLGYEVVTYHATKNGRLKLLEDDFVLNTKWFRPKAKNLGWDNKEQVKQYRKDVKESDLVLSIHGCPHPTKSGAKGDFGWQKLYDIPKKYKVPIVLQFTDNLWDRSYKWIQDVIDNKVTIIYGLYNTGFSSLSKLSEDLHFIDWPIDFDTAYPPQKQRKIDACWMPQWKKWKGIYELINQLAVEPDAFRTVFFNSGIEYYNIRNTEVWAKAIHQENRPKTGPERNTRDYFQKIIHNPKSKADYFGLVYPDQVSQIYANSKVSIELGGAYNKRMVAQNTYCMLEPMLVGCVAATAPEIANDKRSRVYGLDIVHPLDPNALIDSIQDIVKDENRRVYLSGRAYDWAWENCRDEAVSQKVIDLV